MLRLFERIAGLGLTLRTVSRFETGAAEAGVRPDKQQAGVDDRDAGANIEGTVKA